MKVTNLYDIIRAISQIDDMADVQFVSKSYVLDDDIKTTLLTFKIDEIEEQKNDTSNDDLVTEKKATALFDIKLLLFQFKFLSKTL